MLRAVLNHHIGQLVVHVDLDTQRGVFFLPRNFPDDLGSDRARGRECLTHGFGLKTNSSFGQNCGIYATRALPRVCTLFVFEAKHLKTSNKRVRPVFSTVNVCLHIPC